MFDATSLKTGDPGPSGRGQSQQAAQRRRDGSSGSSSSLVRANTQWGDAQSATTLGYAEHWRIFESMLHDCKELPPSERSRPCFNWRSPHSDRGAILQDATACARERLGRESGG